MAACHRIASQTREALRGIERCCRAEQSHRAERPSSASILTAVALLAKASCSGSAGLTTGRMRSRCRRSRQRRASLGGVRYRPASWQPSLPRGRPHPSANAGHLQPPTSLPSTSSRPYSSRRPLLFLPGLAKSGDPPPSLSRQSPSPPPGTPPLCPSSSRPAQAQPPPHLPFKQPPLLLNHSPLLPETFPRMARTDAAWPTRAQEDGKTGRFGKAGGNRQGGGRSLNLECSCLGAWAVRPAPCGGEAGRGQGPKGRGAW